MLFLFLPFHSLSHWYVHFYFSTLIFFYWTRSQVRVGFGNASIFQLTFVDIMELLAVSWLQPLCKFTCIKCLRYNFSLCPGQKMQHWDMNYGRDVLIMKTVTLWDLVPTGVLKRWLLRHQFGSWACVPVLFHTDSDPESILTLNIVHQIPLVLTTVRD